MRGNAHHISGSKKLKFIFIYYLFIHVFFKNRVVSFSKKKTALQESPVYKSTKKYNKHNLILHSNKKISMKNIRQTIVLNFNMWL